MPETPAVQNEVDVQIVDVPSRQGESQDMLNMEDSRRRAALTNELRAELKRLEGSAVGETMMKYAGSKSARRRQQILREKREELKKSTYRREDRWEGPCAPATILNFNPVGLHLYGELQRWSVPASGAGKTIKVTHLGRTFAASYMTLSEPHVWSVIIGTQNDNLAGYDAVTIEARHIPPIGLAHQFYSHYVIGAADAQNMGGIVMFEGDIHTLDKQRLERAEGRIWVPKSETTLDGSGRVVYTVERESFVGCLEDALGKQREYAESVVAEGHSYATSNADLIKNQLTRYHILWHNWAMDHGYKTEAEPWASERLKDSPKIEAVFCPDCRERQKSPEQYFCTNCNAPFDACKAFLAGKAVSPDRLASYDADSPEFKLILAEMRRRKANIAMLELPEEVKETKKPKA